ncbi:MAG: glutathione transferase GstA [Byssovorax sp.]
MYKLYFNPGACSFSPHIVLREAGLPFELEKVDLGTRKTASGADFNAINPKGYVPTLQLENGEILTEGSVIVQYLADQKPESKLAPKAGTMERVRLQEWLTFIATELHKGFGVLFTKAMPDEAKALGRASLEKRFDYLAKSLEGRDYLMGADFTVADAYLFNVLGWCGYVGLSLESRPVLTAYMARIGARPAVQAAQAAEHA